MCKGIINRSDFDVAKLNSCIIMSVDDCFCECFDKLYMGEGLRLMHSSKHIYERYASVLIAHPRLWGLWKGKLMKSCFLVAIFLIDSSYFCWFTTNASLN